MSISLGIYERILSEIINKSKLNSTYLFFIDTNNVFYYKKFLNNNFKNQVDIIYTSSLDNNDMYPYYPFLNIAKNNFDNTKDKKEKLNYLINRNNIFYNHRILVKKFLLDKVVERNEDILEDELAYELNIINDSIIRLLLNSFEDDNRVKMIVIDNFLDLNISSLKLLKFMINNSYKSKVIISVILANHYEYNRYVDELISQVSYKNILFNVKFEEVSNYKIQKNNNYLNPDNMFRILKTNFNLLAIEDSLKIIKNIEENYMISKLSPEEVIEFHIIHGDCHFINDKIDYALNNYNIVYDIALSSNNKSILSLIYSKISYCFFKKGNYIQASNYANLVISLAKEINDELLYIKGLYLLFISEDKNRQLDMKKWLSSYYEIINISKRNKKINLLIYCYTNPFGVYSNYTKEIDKLHGIGIKLAKKRRNIFRLARAYHTRGMAQAVLGNYKKVSKYYKLSRYYNLLLKDYQGITYIYNGLGFYFYLTGNYSEAVLSYFRSLKYLKKLTNYHEIAMTYFNISLVYFLAFEESYALKYLDDMLSLMSVIELKNLSYHSEFGIRSFYGVVSAFKGDYIKAYQAYNHIKENKLKPYPKKNEEFFMYELLKAILEKNNNNSKKSLYHFNKAKYYLKRKNDVISYFEPRFYYELAMLYNKINDKQMYFETLNLGLEVSKNQNNPLYLDIYYKLLSKENNILYNKVHLKYININYWIQAAKLETNLINMHKRINEIQLINKLQEHYLTDISIEGMIKNIMDLVRDCLDLDDLYYYKVEKEDNLKNTNTSINIIYSYSRTKNIITNLIPFIQDNLNNYEFSNNLFVITKEKLTEYKIVGINKLIIGRIVIFDNIKGLLVFSISDLSTLILSNYELNIISIISKQLTIAIERKMWEIEMVKKNRELESVNKELYFAATVDKLTQLNNRESLLRKFQDLNRKKKFILMFLDLDNFKYYNDICGHDFGDEILIKVAEIFRNSVREKDFVARYGGDEFIIIINSTKLDIAERVSDTIIEKIRNLHNSNSCCEYLDKIPQDKKLSVSIGIKFYNGDKDIYDVIKDADKALYDAKKSGKSCYIIG